VFVGVSMCSGVGLFVLLLHNELTDFKNYLAQMLTLMRQSAVHKNHFDTLKCVVKL